MGFEKGKMKNCLTTNNKKKSKYSLIQQKVLDSIIGKAMRR